jgi:hypothetical protein
MRLRTLAFLALLPLACSSSSSTSDGSGSPGPGNRSGGDGGSSSPSNDGGSSTPTNPDSGSVVGPSGDAGGGGDPLVGTWSCTAQNSLTFTKPAGAPPQSATSQSQVRITANGDGTITAETVDDAGGSACPLKYTQSGDSAQLESGQSCSFGTNGTAQYTTGTVTVNGHQLTSTIDYTFSGTVTTDAGIPVNVAGSGTSTYSCTM